MESDVHTGQGLRDYSAEITIIVEADGEFDHVFDSLFNIVMLQHNSWKIPLDDIAKVESFSPISYAEE